MLAIVLGPPLAGVLFNFNPVGMYVTSLAGIGISILVSLLWLPVKSKELI